MHTYPNHPLPEDAPFFVKDYYNYYKTPRGYHTRSLNSNGGWNKTGCMSFLNQPILHYANEIRSAVLVMHGEKAHSCYFSKDTFAAMVKNNPCPDNKELLIIPDTVHTDLYDGGGKNAIPFDKLVYFHGGGFCLGDAGYIHQYEAKYAKNAQCMVVFVHCRTADTTPFPTPFEDCYAALRWVWDNAPSLRVDRERLAVGGDSAGGALAAACTLRSRDEDGPHLCFQLLVYPVTDSRIETESMKKFTDSPLWNAGLNRRMWELYLQDGDCGTPEYAAPMLACDFSGLPPAYVEVEEFDCLRDEGGAYAKALGAAGVEVHLEDVRGTFRGFDFFTSKEISQIMAQKRVQVFRQAFSH